MDTDAGAREGSTTKPHQALRTVGKWHTQESLYREIYARTVSALIAAFVIYLVATIGGYAPTYPGLVLTGISSAVCLVAGAVMALTQPGDASVTGSKLSVKHRLQLRMRQSSRDASGVSLSVLLIMAGISLAVMGVLALVGVART